MNLSQLDPVTAGVGVLALLGVVVAFRSGARAGSKVTRQAREASRAGGVLARAVAFGGVIAAVQWAVISHSTDPVAWGLALGLPAVLAGGALARVFVVTPTEGGGRR